MANCKLYVKNHRYDSCKAPKIHNSTDYLKILKYDVYIYRQVIYQCITKKYCTTFTAKKRKCANCEELLPKCTSNSKFIYY